MTASELIDRLREFDSHAEVHLQLDSRRIAGLFSRVDSDWYHKI